MTNGLQVSSQRQLRQLIEQIEALQNEQRDLGGDIKEKFAEAKNQGFCVKTMRKLIAMRRKSKQEREQEEAMLATYCHALGLSGTPLDEWASDQERQLAVV